MAPGARIPSPKRTSATGRHSPAGLDAAHARARSIACGPPWARALTDPAEGSSTEGSIGRYRSSRTYARSVRLASTIVASRIGSSLHGDIGEQRRDGFAHHAPHPGNPGPSLEGDRSLLDEHLGAIRGTEAAGSRRPDERRFGRDVDEVEHDCVGPKEVDIDGHARVEHPHRRRVDGEAGSFCRVREATSPEVDDLERPAPGATNSRGERLGMLDGAIADGDGPGAGAKAGKHDRMRRAATACDDDVEAFDRAVELGLHGRLEPRGVAVEAHESPVVPPDDVVDRTDRLRVRLDLIDERGDDLLVRRGHAEAEPVTPASGGDRALDLVGLELPQ